MCGNTLTSVEEETPITEAEYSGTSDYLGPVPTPQPEPVAESLHSEPSLPFCAALAVVLGAIEDEATPTEVVETGDTEVHAFSVGGYPFAESGTPR